MTVKEFMDVFKLNDDICVAVNSSDEFVFSVAHGEKAIDPWMMESNISSIEFERGVHFDRMYIFLQDTFDKLIESNDNV